MGLLVYWLLCVVMVGMQMKGCEGCIEMERRGLLEIKAFFVSQGQGQGQDRDAQRGLDSWVDDKASNCCLWTRVKCNNLTNHVTELSLATLSNPSKLNISLLRPFRELLSLDLSSNSFEGWTDNGAGFQSLKKLEILVISGNLLRSSSLSSLSALTSLRTLKLNSNLIDHTIFAQLDFANFSRLEILDLGDNQLNGSLDDAGLSKLKILKLSKCNLNVIPSFLLHQFDLEYLDLSHNKIVGSFPSWLLQNNSRLRLVNLRNNSLFGSFELSSVMWSIHFLDVSKNNMSGQLPINFGLLLPALESLNLSINNFESTVPSSFCEMKILSVLDLSYNHFYGHLPKNLTMGCIPLWVLKLSNNFFQGQFMPKSSKLDKLQWLYLSNNKFSGTMDGLVNCYKLLVVDISNNSISGRIPISINKLPSLRVLLMSENQLQGKIPSELSDIESLAILDLSHNNLSGLIPYLNLSSLRHLYLQKNALRGSIPPTLSESSMLTTIDLRGNKLSGSIPRWINKFPNLRVLLLGGNQLQGQIPVEICQLQNVSIMDLSHNYLRGSIPSCLHNMSFGVVEDDDDGANFERLGDGMIPSLPYCGVLTDADISLNLTFPSIPGDPILIEVEFTTKGNFYSYKGNILAHMSGLDLSSNELDGEIPIQIGNLQQIHALNLSHNHFSSSIPKSFSNLINIESLDLSFNNLSGEIPSQLSQLNFLAVFNVSYNNLFGPTFGAICKL